MGIIQEIDRKKFKQKHPIYQGGSINLPFKSLNSRAWQSQNHPVYLSRKDGGFINLSSILDTAKNIGNLINENKDTINNVASTVSSVANAAKGISDTIKTSKELEKLKTVEDLRRKKKKEKKEDIILTPEQEESLKKIGSGFVKF
jgi:hypothetical protein